MDDDETRRQKARKRVVRVLRLASLGTDAVLVVTTVWGRESVSACAGTLSAAFRCAAELLEGPTQR